MSPVDVEMANMVHAYEVLGVPTTASASTIKRAYRKLARRWHPDLYAAGSVDHANASHMMKVINEAHTMIQHAPLRFRGPDIPKAPPAKGFSPVPHFSSQGMETVPLDTKQLDFWARFLCGAAIGFLPSLYLQFRLAITFSDGDSLVLPFVWVIGMATCGFAAAFAGNQLWYRLTGAKDMLEPRGRSEKQNGR